MSWQRILETARKQGMPVIVTDIAGREPMVILPLEMYERLGEAHSVNRPRVSSAAEPRSVEEKLVMEELAEMAAEDLQKKVDVALDQLSESAPEEPGELSVEERFYLEPVDEDQK